MANRYSAIALQGIGFAALLVAVQGFSPVEESVNYLITIARRFGRR